MDPSLFHLTERHDGPLQFAFHRAVIIDLFGELAGPEIGFVE